MPATPSRHPTSPKKDFSMEWKGGTSGMNMPGLHMATNQQEWEQLWNAVHANRHPAPQAPALPKGKTAIGIFGGLRPDHLDITTRVEETATDFNIVWKADKRPSITRDMHQPFLLKWVDAQDKPVRFTRDTTPAAPRPAHKYRANGPH